MRDNYDMWLSHDNAQEDWLQKRPKCCLCGEHIQEDYAVQLGSDLYCDRCIDDMKVPIDDD